MNSADTVAQTPSTRRSRSRGSSKELGVDASMIKVGVAKFPDVEERGSNKREIMKAINALRTEVRHANSIWEDPSHLLIPLLFGIGAGIGATVAYVTIRKLAK